MLWTKFLSNHRYRCNSPGNGHGVVSLRDLNDKIWTGGNAGLGPGGCPTKGTNPPIHSLPLQYHFLQLLSLLLYNLMLLLELINHHHHHHSWYRASSPSAVVIKDGRRVDKSSIKDGRVVAKSNIKAGRCDDKNNTRDGNIDDESSGKIRAVELGTVLPAKSCCKNILAPSGLTALAGP
jgi:hypothetical protein